MTARVPFSCVDVFATRPLTGNPLSLVTEADGLAEAGGVIARTVPAGQDGYRRGCGAARGHRGHRARQRGSGRRPGAGERG